MAIMEISVVPVGTESPSVSPFVAECVRMVDQLGLQYEVTSMGTEVEGDVEELLKLAAQMHQVPFAKGAQRVVTTIKIDERRDKELKIRGKRQSVLKRLRKRGGGR
jgi:uncharacterized protein (TIGR00106 family)